MSPWELKVGQILGYRPRGDKWRAKVTAIEQDGKFHMGEIPIIDESGAQVNYEEPPAFVSPILDYENYYIVQDVSAPATDPWLAARLDHEDTREAWKNFAEKIGLKEPYYPALASIIEKWAPEGKVGDFVDDLLVFLHAAWRAGVSTENGDCARLIQKRCEERGTICLAHCTHTNDIRAIRDRLKEPF